MLTRFFVYIKPIQLVIIVVVIIDYRINPNIIIIQTPRKRRPPPHFKFPCFLVLVEFLDAARLDLDTVALGL